MQPNPEQLGNCATQSTGKIYIGVIPCMSHLTNAYFKHKSKWLYAKVHKFILIQIDHWTWTLSHQVFTQVITVDQGPITCWQRFTGMQSRARFLKNENKIWGKKLNNDKSKTKGNSRIEIALALVLESRPYAYIEKATDLRKRPEKSLGRTGNLVGEAVELDRKSVV